MNIIEAALLTLQHNISLADLAKASESLSHKYRNALYHQKSLSEHERIAYMLARMPATHAAISAILNEVKQCLPEFQPSSLIDVGAGPGTATWACYEYYSTISQFSLIEHDENWIRLGTILQASHEHLKQAQWIHSDFSLAPSCGERAGERGPADLVIASYALQEITEEKLEHTINNLWHATSHTLILIEPGTPRGFSIINRARTKLNDLGANIVAPCSHAKACPMKGADWCHFSARFERHAQHQAVKRATIGYEDEKYSYLVVSRYKPQAYEARVIKAPLKRSGHIILDVCKSTGIERITATRSQKEFMKLAKKYTWGSRI